MSNLVSKIKNVLLTGPLDVVCGANMVYLAMNGNNLDKYEDVGTRAPISFGNYQTVLISFSIRTVSVY
jgi:hypothetical protein